MDRILTVGLTGGIACGRSTLSRHLRRPGWLVLDADSIVHDLLAPGGAAVDPVVHAFGDGVAGEDGGIDRAALGGLVFRDRTARRRLEEIIHPLVYREIDRRTEAFASERGQGIVVVDAALMIETGSYRRYDRIVVAHCPPEVQLRRVMKRDGLTEDEALRRIRAQAPLQEKIDLADYTIETSGTLEETARRTRSVAERLERDLQDKLAGRPLPPAGSP